jgi:hypothetical protein
MFFLFEVVFTLYADVKEIPTEMVTVADRANLPRAHRLGHLGIVFSP